MDVDEWADEYRVLTTKTSAVAGPWRTDRNPVARIPMKWLSRSHPCHTVTLMLASQVCKTEVGINFVFYLAHLHPRPIIAAQPTRNTAKKFSKQRIRPVIKKTEPIRRLVRGDHNDARKDDTIYEKDFPGGWLAIIWASSAAEMASMPMGAAFLDEIDRYVEDADGEGDPVDIIKKRLSNFPDSKCLQTSTPTIKGHSRIESEWEKSTQHKIEVPCPHCGVYQVLEWERLDWPEGEPEKAKYLCAHCEQLVDDKHKKWMLDRLEPVVVGDGDPGHMGLQANALYSPPGIGVTWAELAREREEAEDDTHQLRVFVNTRLGETFESQGEQPDWEKLYFRREGYTEGVVPDGGVVLTAGVDVQADRLEVEIVAWGPGLESWSVAYHVIEGDTVSAKPWDDLSGLIEKRYPHESGGDLKISRTFIDSGYRTSKVYRYSEGYHWMTVTPVKGQSKMVTAISKPRTIDQLPDGTKLKGGMKLIHVGTDHIKRELYGWLGQPLPDDEGDDEEVEEYPEGWCHFPEYGKEYFKQLCAEKEVVRMHRGRPSYVFETTRERNEALDCRVYARAAAKAEGLDRWSEKQWKQKRSQIAKPKKKPKRRRRSREGRRNRDSGRRRKGDWLK